ncbi:MAG TPA: cob(I)yrinic acid a,c-diamide adenosyltransferase, partial [Gaiellaceae bacterium]|nr:cob(I)yrinic acid a,c-diamide adenosyltransferase [Gaiellaceae bacterium]
MRSRDEPVRLTRIYTRGGDGGETSLGDGSRVSKLDCRIGAFGTVDELNAALGVVVAGELPESLREPLTRIQNELFDVGADLSVPWGVTDRLRVEQGMIDRLEGLCDAFNAELPELRSFVLPGGTDAAARLHVARTICRRAERDVLVGSEEVELNPLVLAYLNRLSDLLFILARAANAAAGRDEPVRLTRIYTRGGDAGETSLGDGSRVSKLDCRIGAFGTVDELNAAIGVVLAT